MAPTGTGQRTLTSVEILVVGAGPVGLALGLQAHQHGARVGVVERRAPLERPSRAMLLWPRSLHALDRLGVVDKLKALPAAQLQTTLHLGRPVFTGTELLGLDFDREGAVATLTSRDERSQVKCRFVVGCDGADSTVRHLARIPWRGHTYPQEAVLADLHLEGLSPSVAHIGAGRAGIGFLFPAGEHGATWRLVATRVSRGAETPPGHDGPPLPVPELQTVLAGANLPGRITAAAWSTRVRLQRRRAGSFQTGPVFLAGDAAHVFSPAGAQGMNTGLQDATNLGWKLATALHGSIDPQALVASYQAERRPVASQAGALTGLLLRGEGSDRLLPRFARVHVLPIVAPAVPALLRVRPLPALAGWVLSQGWVCYGASPITDHRGCRPGSHPRPGCFAPAMDLTVHGQHFSLHDLIAEPATHLLHGHAFPVEQLGAMQGVRVHCIDDWPAARALAVRPDGYIGYYDPAGSPAPLLRWLRVVGGL